MRVMNRSISILLHRYMDQFKFPSSENITLFEKSATYFTHSLSPKRYLALIDDKKSCLSIYIV